MSRGPFLATSIILIVTSCSNSDESNSTTPVANACTSSDSSAMAAATSAVVNFCSGGAVRYNTETFANVATSADIAYGSNQNLDGSNQTLKLDLYTPIGDSEPARPLIVFAHGGGFIGGTKNQGETFAKYLAKAGYVVASIQYRLIDSNTQLAIALGSKQMTIVVKQALVNAVHDMKAAIRFLVNNNASNSYGIDTSKIFLAGYSAGALTSLHTAYLLSTSELTGESDLVTYINANGGVVGDTDSSPSSSSATGYTIKGVLNIAGSVISTSILNANEPALFSIHGTADPTVPYTSGNTDNTGVTTCGSSSIQTAATAAGLSSNLFTVNGGDHDVFAEGVEASGCESCQEMAREFFYCNLN